MNPLRYQKPEKTNIYGPSKNCDGGENKSKNC